MAILKMKRAEKAQVPVTKRIISELKGPLIIVGLFSFLISILTLAVPLYMLNLFDRVLTSQSVETLIALTLITMALMVSLGFLEGIRSRALVRMGVRFDEVVGRRVFDALARTNIEQRIGAGTLAQVDQVRGFVSSTALTAFFDLPFVPIFLTVLYLLHPWLGGLGMAIGIGVVLLGLSLEWTCKQEKKEGSKQSGRAARFADNALRNAEVASAMGMVGKLRRRWEIDHNVGVDTSTRASDTISSINGALKAFMLLSQISMLGLACYLVLLEEVTAGAMFAANILAMRMISPINQSVSAWRGFLGARDALDNLANLLATMPEDGDRLRLPAPSGAVECEKVSVAAPGSNELILKGVSFSLEPGEALGVIGPNGSGKSSLGRVLVGVWRPTAGNVRLDGADVFIWNSDDLGPYIGYLPQDIGLFDGTIAENIGRFGEQNDEAVIKAARKAGIHEMILRQADGYDTEVRSRGGILSGGQRQRLGLARAVYGDPKLVVLDEPNSNLDTEGEQALVMMIEWLKRINSTVVVIAHNPRLLKSMDKILMLQEGRVAQYGVRDEVLPKLQLIKGKKIGDVPRIASEEKAAEGGQGS